jgi:hypothetical protein
LDRWVVIQLNVGEGNGSLLYTIAGKVVGSSTTGGQVWIRVAGLYSSIIADTQMSKDGTFQFELPGGVYVVATRSGTRVIDTRTFAGPNPQLQISTIVPLEIKLQ